MSFLSQLVNEINKVRTNPSSYASKIEECATHFQGKILRLPNTNVGIKTQEGADAYNECAEFLRSAQSTDAQVPSKGLTHIANELLAVVQKDASKIGSVDMNAIIDKYGSFTGAFNRVMECGGSTPEQVVINLLVSDGDKNRSQRDALLNRSSKRIGVASGDHEIYRNATIIIFCTQFENTYDSDDSESYGGPRYEPPKPKEEPPKQTQQSQQSQPQSHYEPEPSQSQPSGLPLLKEKIVDNKKPAASSEEPTDDNIVSVDRAERIVVDGGKKKKKITFTKHFKDGHTEKEVKFESL